MSADGVDLKRRRTLTLATSAFGAVGAGFVAVPFLASWNPSERAKAAGAPVEADISKLEPGQLLRVKWRGKPVWVVSRTEKNQQELARDDAELADANSEMVQQPSYCQNPTRSIKAKYLVAVGICTHLGCSPTYMPKRTIDGLPENWKGGFFCPCHGSRFDLAGRVFAGLPAPTNLVIPKHQYLSDTTLLIGEDGGAS